MRICRDCGSDDRVNHGLCARCRAKDVHLQSEFSKAGRRRPKRPELEPLHNPRWLPKG